MQNGDSASDARGLFGGSVTRAVALVLLLSVSAIWESGSLHSLTNPEIWGHLKLGSWILQSRSWPKFGLFSQADKTPWRDLNWTYDLLVALAYRLLGLRAVPAMLVFFRVALAAVTFVLAGGWRNFWGALALSAMAQYVLAGIGPDAVCVSVILLGIELSLLLDTQNSGNLRRLYFLPVLFFFWANLGIGFIHGLALYILFFFAMAFEQLGRAGNWRWLQKPDAAIPLRSAGIVGITCVLASLLNPSGYHAYSDFFAFQTSAVNSYLPGYAAMTFHQPRDYVLMLLAMTAFLFLGIRRCRDLFQFGLLIGCSSLAFHSQRDNWLLALAAVACIGRAIPQRNEESSAQQTQIWKCQTLLPIAASLVLVCLAFTVRVPRQREALLAKIAARYPVRASDFIRQHQLPAPLFNCYAWGGFLTWYLPEYPVAIDSRRGLYPEQEEIDYFKAMKADIPYQAFPPMRLARTLLFEKPGVMGEALRDLPGFQVAYEDEISIVLLQQQKE
ncbi:MAG: hypothetical protein WBL50_08365 [Candidatus Acidiferrum sp.]